MKAFLLLDLAVISVREKIPGFGAEPHQKIDVVILVKPLEASDSLSVGG
jgi:hypothetical protein